MLRLICKSLAALCVLLLMLLPFWATWKCRLPRLNARLVRIAFYLGCIVWGIKVDTKGAPLDKTPLLIVSNHFSYLDVFVLGGRVAMRFTPKSDVRAWPVIGFFCAITGCLFIDRRPHRTLENKAMLAEAIEGGVPIHLFPEGTTSDGSGVLPFRSSFFTVAENRDFAVQPVSIAYKSLDGEPVTAVNRHLVGWYADMEFFPHLVAFLRRRSLQVVLTFHPPVNGRNFASRKELARYCQSVIETDVGRSARD